MTVKTEATGFAFLICVCVCGMSVQYDCYDVCMYLCIHYNITEHLYIKKY